MPQAVLFGTLAVLAGGISTGSFALPMKFIRRWPWENIWLLYSLFGLILLPWIAAAATVPHLMQVYESVPGRTLLMTGLFGFGWGAANVLFGLAVAAIGMAIAFAIVAGLSAAVGSLIPLIALTPERLPTASGRTILLGVALTVCGVAILGIAGRARERALKTTRTANRLGLGLLLSVVAGLFGPMLNFSFAFGSEIAKEAARHGASTSDASHAIWAIALLGGFSSNGGYAMWKLFRNGKWPSFAIRGAAFEWSLSALMGILFGLGFLLYGRGANALGQLGPSIGWPVFQATTIMVSTAAGAASGEWRGAGRRFALMNGAALAILIGAIIVLSIGNRA